MRYLLCLIPPLAILLCGRPFQAFFNLILCLVAIPSGGISLMPAIVWAILVTMMWYNDQREARILRAIRESRSPR
jgi:hypothetical protein